MPDTSDRRAAPSRPARPPQRGGGVPYQEAWADPAGIGSTRAATQGSDQRSCCCTASPTTSTATTASSRGGTRPGGSSPSTFGAGRASDGPAGYPDTAANQTGDLDAVIGQLGLDQVTIVVDDASGPPGIDWALEHPDRVALLILLDTSYCLMPTLRPPQAIALDSTPLLRNLGRGLARALPSWDRRAYRWQVGRFITAAAVRQELVPPLYQAFLAARPPVWTLNNDLLATVISRTRRIPQLRRFTGPGRIIFGARYPYLNRGVARRFHRLFPACELFLVADAGHYVQVDQPEQLASHILA